jgi:hypothetical protein
MRKTISLMTMILLLSFSAKTNAQILTPDAQAREITEYNIYTSDNLSEDHSAKIVKWSNDLSVVLNTLASNNQATFGLLKKGTINTLKTVYMPIGYKINDFTIFNDTLYFVGNKADAIDTTKGIIGYVKVMDLFTQPNQSCTYAEIRSTKDLFRVEAYNDNTGKTIVAAVGRQVYGIPYFVDGPGVDVGEPPQPGLELPLPDDAEIVEPAVTGENQPLSNSLNEIGPAWYTDTLRYRHCLATLNITRTSNGVNHQYDLWTLPHLEDVEEVKGLCLTKDYVCVVSTCRKDEIQGETKIFALYWLDKNNFNVRYSQQIYGSTYAFVANTIRGNIKMIGVGENNIAICYMGETSENCNVLYKMNLTSTTLNPIFTHYFGTSGNGLKHKIWDLEYVERENMLVVLKQSNIYEEVDELWYLSLNDNIMMPYQVYVHTNDYENLSSLELYSEVYLGIYGEQSTNKTLLEKRCNQFLSLHACYHMREEKVHEEQLPIVQAHQVMLHCSFADIMPSLYDLLTLPANQNVDTFNALQINQEQITSPCSNTNVDIHYEQPQTIK